jgi:hypothetical protein
MYIDIAALVRARISTNYAVHQEVYISNELIAFLVIRGFKYYVNVTARN